MMVPSYVYPPSDQVVVTANRIETSEDQIASSFSALTEEDVERKQKSEVADLLREGVGLGVVNSGGPGKPTAVFVRGADPNAVLVLIDGVEMNDALSTGNGYNFGNFSSQDIDRIEVIRGAQSVLYGSGATAGVIQVFTKKGRGPLRATVEGEYGTYQSWRLQGNLRGSLGKFNYYLGAGEIGTEGFPASDQALGNQLKNGQQMTTLTGNFGIQLSPQSTLEVSTRFSHSKFTYSSGGPPGYDHFGFRTGDDPGYSGTDEQRYGKVRYYSRGSDLWQPQIAVTYSLDHRTACHAPNPLNESRAEYVYDSDRTRILFQNDLEVSEAQTVTLGSDVSFERGNAVELSSSWSGDQGLKDKSSYVLGAYAQDFVRFGNFFGTLGGRFDHHQYAGSAFTYRLAPGYRWDLTKTTVRASVGSGFKAPSLHQLFSIFGNLDLQPEKSTSFDLGLDQEVFQPTHRLSLTVFRANYRDRIEFNFRNQKSDNILTAHTEGMELGFQADVNRVYSLRLSYQYLIAVDEGTGLPLLRRPTHQFSSEWSYRPNDPLEFGASVRYFGARSDLDAVTYSHVFMPPFTVAGLTAHYRPNSSLHFYGRVDNLLNLTYEEANGYGTPLRSVYVGVSATL